MNLKETLQKYQKSIVEEWMFRLHNEVSDRYKSRPMSELYKTVSMAADANYAMLINKDFETINNHIQWISKIRLDGEFSLSEVQTAYELYRTIIMPLLPKELNERDLHNALKDINSSLFYTITKFSNYFQHLHESHLKTYTETLEKEVKNRTRELADSEYKYRMLVEEINEGYFILKDGVITFANKAFSEMHSYEKEEVIGKRYLDLVSHSSLSVVNNIFDSKLNVSYGKEASYVYMRLNKNGKSYPTESKVKIINYTGQDAVLGICRDITQKMEMEKKIYEAEKLAHIGKLTTSLAHEIRNPLSSVKMNVQIFLKSMNLEGNDKRRMEIIDSEITRLEKILTDMLDFAKNIRLDFELCNINKIIEFCLDLLDFKIKERNIVVKKKYDKNIDFTKLDKDKLSQAILNIILNSIEAISENGIIDIKTKINKLKSHIQISISDNGIGIKDEDLPFIFDPFFSAKKKGTGLGLTNTKKIIEAHNGFILVERNKVVGTKFIITIPCKERKDKEDTYH